MGGGSCTLPRALNCWCNPLNVCTLYIKCCHTCQLPFSVDSIIPSCLCVCMFANVWAQLDLFLSVWVSRCRGGKITHKTSHNNNSPRIHSSLFCDLFKDLFLCWWSTFLLMLTLKAAFWFNVKIDYFGSVVCLTQCTPQWRWADSATVMSPLGQDMAELKKAHCSQQWFFS